MTNPQDLAYNELNFGTSVQFFGWRQPALQQSLQIYNFFPESIRQEDARSGFFLKRYLIGMQSKWEESYSRIFEITNLFDIQTIEDEYLRYLQHLVGWTGDLAAVTNRVDNDTLRRLIAVSVSLWKNKGSEDSTINVLSLTTQQQCRMWNWFDFRWVLDKTQLGEDHQGRDPHVIDLPGASPWPEYTSNLRIVDDGYLDRYLVRELVKIMRPASERVQITYITFMDLFNITGDTASWSVQAGEMVVEDGNLKLLGTMGQFAVVNITEASYWDNYVYYARIKATSIGGKEFGIGFYVQNLPLMIGYFVGISLVTNVVRLYYVDGMSWFTLVETDYNAFGAIYPDVYYGLRVETTKFGDVNKINVYIDANRVIEYSDSALTSGTIVVWHESGLNTFTDEVEIFRLPLDSELVDINP